MTSRSTHVMVKFVVAVLLLMYVDVLVLVCGEIKNTCRDVNRLEHLMIEVEEFDRSHMNHMYGWRLFSLCAPSVVHSPN